MQGIDRFLHAADSGESIGGGLQIGRLRMVKVFVAFDFLEKAARLVFFRRRLFFAACGKISAKTFYIGQPAPGKDAAAPGEIFAEGAAKQGIAREKADEIFDYMEKFAGYGFNKSHAAAYALISYQTAWLKAHYPAEFMAATMSSELTDTDQLKLFYEDALANGITFLPPDINESDYLFTPDGERHIRYALGAVKGVGEGAVQSIVEARQDGRFRDLFDFCERVGKEHMNKRTLESLIKAGAFDGINPNRAMLLANIDLAIGNAEQQAANANQGGLFDFAEDAISAIEMVETAPWGDAVKLAEEKSVIGFYFSGHPFGPYAEEIRRFAPQKLSKLKPQDSVRVAGFATAIRTIMGKNGKLAFVRLEDTEGSAEAIVAGELLEQSKNILKTDQVLIMECRISRNDYNGGELRINANSVMTLPQAREKFARNLTLTCRPEHDIEALLNLLAQYRSSGREGIPLRVRYRNDTAEGELDLQRRWQINADAALFEQLQNLLGEYGVNVGW